MKGLSMPRGQTPPDVLKEQLRTKQNELDQMQLNSTEENPIAMVTREEKSEEVEKLRALVAEQGRTIQSLHDTANAPTRKDYEPNGEVMQHIWDMAYQCALNSIFTKGLTFWKSKAAALKQEMELAAIRADEAVEAFNEVRRVSRDPVKRELQDWQRTTSTNSLVKP